ncbi:MAG: FAD:protein FMN transferase [Candidatus Hydrogenedentes bacterium]|nr:FAD:protein FMN transferase [Candidatus Hydrogenedentota bacterium]
MPIVFLLLGLARSVSAWAQPESSPVAQTFKHEAMATEFEFTLCSRPEDKDGRNLEVIARQAFAEVDYLEDRISNWQPLSQISRINRDAAAQPVGADEEIIKLLLDCRRMTEATNGAFDISVGPLIRLYGFYRKSGRLPNEEELSEARACVGMDKVVINKDERTVFFTRKGVSLDFGGIGKGMALDKAADVLRKNGISNALLNAGTSSVLGIGAPPGENGWTVRIRHPRRTNDIIATVVIKDESLSTSGCYGQQMVVDGEVICHILDPRTGKPITGMLTASAIARTATETDALSTAFMVLGPEGTREYCKQHKDVRAILAAVPDQGEPTPEHLNFDE